MSIENEVELKAKELVEKFYFKYRQTGRSYEAALKTAKHKRSLAFLRAIGAALISVDEILNALNRMAVKGQEYQVIKDYIKIKEKIKTL